MPKAQPKTNAMRILEHEKIAYQMYTYEVDEEHLDGVSVARQLGQNPDIVYKTLVCRGHDRQIAVFVIPVAQELDLKKAAKISGQKSMELIHVSEIQGLTGYIRGGCSPVGMKKQYPTWIHEAAQNLPTVIVSGGKRGIQVEVCPTQLVQICQGRFADLIQSKKGENL